MFKKQTLVAALALAFAGASYGATTTFQFDPTGGGGTGVTVATIDEAPGNVLAIGGAGALTVGQQITDLYQANLQTLNNDNGDIVFANGAGGRFFTVVAGFGEVVTSVGPGTATFALDPSASSFFYICAQGASGNNLAGTGFACADPILSGHATELVGNQTVFPAGTTPPPLDGFNADNRSPTKTLVSTGATSLTVRIDSANAGYFPGMNPGENIVLSFTNTSQVTPFLEVNPSFVFSSNGHANGDTPDAIGLLNGVSGPNFQFQADANTSLSITPTVPEPGTLALGGLALTGIAMLRRRRNQQ